MLFFFFNDTATTEIYTLSLHDALPISLHRAGGGCALPAGLPRRRHRGRHGVDPRGGDRGAADRPRGAVRSRLLPDRKSTRLNSSHANISYAVFCLKKKKKNINNLYI